MRYGGVILALAVASTANAQAQLLSVLAAANVAGVANYITQLPQSYIAEAASDLPAVASRVSQDLATGGATYTSGWPSSAVSFLESAISFTPSPTAAATTTESSSASSGSATGSRSSSSSGTSSVSSSSSSHAGAASLPTPYVAAGLAGVAGIAAVLAL